MPDILIDSAGGITTLTINRVEKKNSFTQAMYGVMADAIAQAKKDTTVRVVLIQGDARIFSAGNDISDFLTNPPKGLDAPVFQFLRSLASFPKPVIAAVCGPAVGIGTTMLFHCDLVYAGDNAVFSMPFVNLGVCPEAGSSVLASQLMGYHRAAEALMMGEPFPAQTAYELGLVNGIIAPEEVNALAQAQALKLAAKPLASLLETKRLMKKHLLPQLLSAIEEEAQSFGRMLDEPAAKEAFTAFMEKRRPDFSKL